MEHGILEQEKDDRRKGVHSNKTQNSVNVVTVLSNIEHKSIWQTSSILLVL